MNKYHKAMDNYPLPDGLEERMRERVLSAAPPKKHRVFKPKTPKKRLILALAALMFLTTGAAFVVPWDPFFSQRYGIFNVIAENAFRKVNVTAVCDDVTITVREVIGDSSSLSYILDYRLPDDTPQEVLERLEAGEGAYPKGSIFYLMRGDVTWEEYKASDAEKWAKVDWADYYSCNEYWVSDDNLVYDYDEQARTAGESGRLRFDPETRTITYLWRYDLNSPDVNFTSQPLTIVMTPPMLSRPNVALADHPTLITFQPDYQTTERAGTFHEDGVTINAKLTSMACFINYQGTAYDHYEEVAHDVTLVYSNGFEVPLTLVAALHGGSEFHTADGTPEELDFSADFILLTDTSTITAIRVGEHEIPLHDAE